MKEVLVVDDEQVIRDVCEEYLEEHNFAVITAKNGKIASQIMQDEDNIDTVVTDIYMPEMDGLKFIEKLNKDYPEVAIVAISGGTKINSAEYLKKAKGIGADLILEKPFDLAKLGKFLKQNKKKNRPNN